MNLTKTAENLRKRGFEASVFETKEAAAEYLNKEINNMTVAFGGSITVEQMGLYESLGEHNEVIWHWRNGSSGPEAAFSDIYISSVNGMAENGQMILIDGKGNRVGAVMCGHKKVYLVVGKNKIEDDYDKAMYRARNVSAPLNAKRLNKKTPCVAGGKCFDCNSPDRICCYFMTIEHPCSAGMPTEVVLINEDLGY